MTQPQGDAVSAIGLNLFSFITPMYQSTSILFITALAMLTALTSLTGQTSDALEDQHVQSKVDTATQIQWGGALDLFYREFDNLSGFQGRVLFRKVVGNWNVISSLAGYFQGWYSFDVNLTYDLVHFGGRSYFYPIFGLNYMNGSSRLGGAGGNIGIGLNIESRVFLECKITLERFEAPGAGLNFGVYFSR